MPDRNKERIALRMISANDGMTVKELRAHNVSDETIIDLEEASYIKPASGKRVVLTKSGIAHMNSR